MLPTGENISLLESLDGECIRLFYEVMQECGPAAQTFGGVLQVTNRESFVETSRIADAALLPLRTVRRHFVTLERAELIANRGRQPTPSGRARRTVTRTITTKGKAAAAGKYGLLPWWACQLRWADKCILSMVMSKFAGLKTAVDERLGGFGDDDEFWGHFDNVRAEKRFRFSVADLARMTGLGRPAVILAKRRLSQCGLVDWIRVNADDGTCHDLLVPNRNFRCYVQPTTNARVRLRFDRGMKVAKGG